VDKTIQIYAVFRLGEFADNDFQHNGYFFQLWQEYVDVRFSEEIHMVRLRFDDNNE